MGKPVLLVELSALVWPQIMQSGQANASGSAVRGNTRVPIVSGHSYKVTAICRRSAAANGAMFLGVDMFDSSGTYLNGLSSVAASTAGLTNWTTYTGTFGPATANPITGSAVTMTPRAHLNYGASAGVHECMLLMIEDLSALGVVLSADPNMRDPSEWSLYGGTPISFLTDTSSSSTQALTLRYSNIPYITDFWDVPSKMQYDARVLQPGQLRMALPDVAGGSITISYGQIVLNNADGELGDLAYYGLDGQPFVVRMGFDDQVLSDFTEVMRGTMEQATVDRKSVTVRLIGRDSVLDQPLLKARYLGNNSLPNGLEGSSELEGQPKPRLYGNAVGLSPPCVNTSRLIYEVGKGVAPTAAVTNVWVAGVALSAGTAYTSQSDMETNAPSAGQYRVWPGGGYFRLGSTPAGVVTCDADATETSYGTGNWWWKLLYRMAIDGGVATGDMQFSISDSFTQPNNWPGGSWPGDQGALGVWVTDANMTARQAMDLVAKSFSAWYGYTQWGGTPGGAMTFGAEIFPPNTSTIDSTTPVLDASNVLGVNPVADPGTGRGVPAWSVDLSYAQNYTVLTPSMAPTVAPTALGRLGIKNKRVATAAAGVLNKHATARPVVKDTAFSDYAPAVSNEATRQLELQRFQKLWFDVRVSLAALLEMTTRPRLGGYVQFGYPGLVVKWQDGINRAYGNFTVQAIEVDFVRGEARLRLRQATEQSI